MMNRTALAALLLTLAAPSWATGEALQSAGRLAAGGSASATYDGTRGSQRPVSEGEAGRIQRASDGALATGGLVVAKDRVEVPAPSLVADSPGSKDKPGFFKNLFSGKGWMYSLGGAVAGAGIGWWVGGMIGAVGGLLGAAIGFYLSKLLAK